MTASTDIIFQVLRSFSRLDERLCGLCRPITYLVSVPDYTLHDLVPIDCAYFIHFLKLSRLMPSKFNFVVPLFVRLITGNY